MFALDHLVKALDLDMVYDVRLHVAWLKLTMGMHDMCLFPLSVFRDWDTSVV